MKKSIRIIMMIALIVLVAACLMSCDKGNKGPTIIEEDPGTVSPTLTANKTELMRMISDGMIEARAEIDSSDTSYVYSHYMVRTGDINYTVTYEANYRDKKQESEIYLKIFDNYEHANRIFAYYNKGTLYLESMYGKQRLDNFGTSASFDLFYSVATMLDATTMIFSPSMALLFDPDNIGANLSALVDQERITYIAVTDTASSIEMTDVNLNYGQIKNVINNTIKDTFSPFESKLDLLTMKYLGMRLSYLASLEISTANGDLINARLEGDRLDTLIIEASGMMADAINDFEITVTVTARPGTGEIVLDDLENPYLDSAYEPMRLGHYNYAGVLKLPILDDLEFDATFRSILSTTDNTVNQIVFTLENISTDENAGGIYYKDQILYADISGVQEFLGDCVEMSKMNLPQVNFTGFNLAQELTLLINDLIKFVDSAKGDDIYGENKEMLNTVLDHIESDEPNSTISIRITQELLELFNDGQSIDFATWIAKTLGLRPELVKQILGNRTMENMTILLTYNVDVGTIGVYVYDGDYLAVSLVMDKIDDLGVDKLPYPSFFRPDEFNELIFPENTILAMSGVLSMQEVQSVRFDQLFGTLMCDITGVNTPYILKSSEQLHFTLQLMQEYEYIELEDGTLEQKIRQTLKLEVYKQNILQFGVYSCNSTDPDPVKRDEEESMLLVNFNVAIGPEGVTKDGYNYEKRVLKYRVKREKVVEACNELLGEDNIFATTNIMDLFSMITSALQGSTSMKMRFTGEGFTFNLHKDPIKDLIGVDNLYATVSAKIKFAMNEEEKLKLSIPKSLYATPKISGTRIDEKETTKLESQTAESIYQARWQEYAFVYFNEERINPMRLKLSFTEKSTKIVSARYLYSPEAALLGDTVTYDLRILDRENGTRLVAALINPNTPTDDTNLISALQTWYIDPSMVSSLPETMPVLYVDGVRGAVSYEIDGFDASNINLAGFNDARYTIVIGRDSVAETKIIVSIGVLNRVIIPVNNETSYPEGAPIVAEIVIDPYTYAVRKADNASWSPLPSSITLNFEALPPKSKEYVTYLNAIKEEAAATFLPLPVTATDDEKIARNNDILIKAWIMAYERTITPEDLKLQMETLLEQYSTTTETRHRAWAELLTILDETVLREQNTPNTTVLNNPAWDFDFNNIRFNGGMFFTHTYFNNVKIAMKVYVKSKVISHMKLVDVQNITVANEENRPFTEADGMYTVDLLERSSYTFPVNSTERQEFRVYFTDGTYRIIGTADHQSSDVSYYNRYLPILLEWTCPEVVIKREAGTIEPLGREYKSTNTAIIGGSYTVGEQTLEMTVFEPGRTQARIGYSDIVNAATGYGREGTEYDFDTVTTTAVQPTKAAFDKNSAYGSYFILNPYNIQPLPSTVFIQVEQGDKNRFLKKEYSVKWQEDDIVKRNDDGTYSIRNISLEERLLRVRGLVGDGDIVLEVVMIVRSLSAQYKSITFSGLEEGVTTINIDPYASYTLPDGFNLTLSSDEIVSSNGISWFISIGDMATLSDNRWMLQFYGRNYSWLYDYIRYKNGVDRTLSLSDIIPDGFSEPTEDEYNTFIAYIDSGEIPITSEYVFPNAGGEFVLHSYVEASDKIIAQTVSLNVVVQPRTLVVSAEGNGRTRVDLLADGTGSAENYSIDTYKASSSAFLDRINKIVQLTVKKEEILDPLLIRMNEIRRENTHESDAVVYGLIYDYIKDELLTDALDKARLVAIYEEHGGDYSSTIMQYINELTVEISEANVGLYFGDVSSTANQRYDLFVRWTNIHDLINVLKSQSGAVLGFALTGYIGYGEANMQQVVIPIYINERKITKLEFSFDELNTATSQYAGLTTAADTYTINYDYAFLTDHVTEIENYCLFNPDIQADAKYTAVFARILSYDRITDTEKTFLKDSYANAYNENQYLSEEEAYSIAVDALKAYRSEKASLLRTTLSATLQDYTIADKYTHVYNVIYSHSTTQDYEKDILDAIVLGLSELSGETKYEAVINTYLENRATMSGMITIDIAKPLGFQQIDALGNKTFVDPKEYFTKAFSTLNLTFADRTEDKYSPVYSIANNFNDYILTSSDEAKAARKPDPKVENRYYSEYVLNISNLSAGSCVNPISIYFRSVVDTCGGLSGGPTADESEPFDEFGVSKYGDGFTLPQKLMVNYDRSGTVTFGNINNWTVTSGVYGKETDDPISVIPANAINVLNSEGDIRVQCALPCNQGTYYYVINFPNKYIGETMYTGAADDRNYSMLDIVDGKITIDDYFTVYKSNGTTAQNILSKMPTTISVQSYDFSAGVEYVAGTGETADVIPASYELSRNNGYNPEWKLVSEWATGNYIIDRNGMTSRVMQSGGYDFKEEHKLYYTEYDGVQDKNVSVFSGYVLFATADISSYYYLSSNENRMKPLVQKVKVYIKVSEMLDPVATYEGLLDINDENSIEFDPYNSEYDYNGNLTLPMNNLKVYFNGSTSDCYHIFNTDDKLSYYLKMEDTDTTVKALLFRSLLGRSDFTIQEKLSAYALYMESLGKQYAAKLGLSVSDARQRLYASAYDVLLDDGSLLASDQLRQRKFIADYTLQLLNNTYVDDGFGYVAGYDALYSAYATQQTKKRAVYSAYLRALSSESAQSILENVDLLEDVYNMLYTQTGSASTIMADIVDEIYGKLTVEEKKAMYLMLEQVPAYQQIMLDALTAALAENPDATAADAMDIAHMVLEGRLKGELLRYMAAVNSLADELYALNDNYSTEYYSHAVAIVLLGRYLGDTNLEVVARAFDSSAYGWDALGEASVNKVNALKTKIFRAYLNKAVQTASLAKEVLNIYFGIGNRSVSRYKEIVISNLLNNYTYDGALYTAYYGAENGLNTKYAISTTVLGQMEYDVRYIGLMTEEEWRLGEARAEAWEKLVLSMTGSSTVISRLNSVVTAEAVKIGAYQRIMSDRTFAALVPYIEARFDFIGVVPANATNINIVNVMTYLMSDSSTLSMSQKALMLTALYIIHDGIEETERKITAVAYTQAGHAISEIDNNILTIVLVLPDGQTITLKLEIFSRIIEKVMVDSTVTDESEKESQVTLPNIYYIDPYNSDTLKLPTEAQFVFETDTLTLPIDEWTQYDADKFYSTGGGIYYYRNTENSYEGGSFVLQSYLSYGSGSMVSRQYFELLVVVLNRKLNIVYSDEYEFENPVAGRVKDIPVSLESSMFVNCEDYYDDEIIAFFAQYEADHGVSIDPQSVFYSRFGVPLIPEINWYKTTHNPSGINDGDIDMTGGFDKAVQGYISTANNRLVSDYAVINGQIKKNYESNVKPLAWEMLFEESVGGEKTVKTVFSGEAKAEIEAFEQEITETVRIAAYERMVQESDNALKETINLLMVMFRNNTAGSPLLESDPLWYVEFFNDLKAKSERNILTTDERTVYGKFVDNVNVIEARSLTSLRMAAWDSLVASPALTANQLSVCNKYVADIYSLYESDIAIYCYDAIVKLLTEQEASAMASVMRELAVVYGNTVSGVAKAKQYAFSYLLNYYSDSVGYVWGEKATVRISAEKWTLKNLYEVYNEITQTELESVIYNIYSQSSTFDSYEALFEIATSFFGEAAGNIPYTEITDFDQFKEAAIASVKAYLEEQAIAGFVTVENAVNGGPSDDYNVKSTFYDYIITEKRAEIQAIVDNVRNTLHEANPSLTEYDLSRSTWEQLKNTAVDEWKQWFIDEDANISTYDEALAKYVKERTDKENAYATEAFETVYMEKYAKIAWDTITESYSVSSHAGALNNCTPDEILYRNTLKEARRILIENFTTSDQQTALGYPQELASSTQHSRYYLVFQRNYPASSEALSSKGSLRMCDAVSLVGNYFNGYKAAFAFIMENPSLVGESSGSLQRLYASLCKDYAFVGANYLDYIAKPLLVTRFLATEYAANVQPVIDAFIDGLKVSAWGYVVSYNCTEEIYNEETDPNEGNVGFVYDDTQSFKVNYRVQPFLGLSVADLIVRIKADAFELLKKNAVIGSECEEFTNAYADFLSTTAEEIMADALAFITPVEGTSDLTEEWNEPVTVALLWNEISDVIEENNFLDYADIIENDMSIDNVFNIYNVYYSTAYQRSVNTAELCALLRGNAPAAEKRALMNAVDLNTVLNNLTNPDEDLKNRLYACFLFVEDYLYSYLRESDVNVNVVCIEDYQAALMNYCAQYASAKCVEEIRALLFPYTTAGAKVTIWNRIYAASDESGRDVMTTFLRAAELTSPESDETALIVEGWDAYLASSYVTAAEKTALVSAYDNYRNAIMFRKQRVLQKNAASALIRGYDETVRETFVYNTVYEVVYAAADTAKKNLLDNLYEAVQNSALACGYAEATNASLMNRRLALEIYAGLASAEEIAAVCSGAYSDLADELAVVTADDKANVSLYLEMADTTAVSAAKKLAADEVLWTKYREIAIRNGESASTLSAILAEKGGNYTAAVDELSRSGGIFGGTTLETLLTEREEAYDKIVDMETLVLMFEHYSTEDWDFAVQDARYRRLYYGNEHTIPDNYLLYPEVILNYVDVSERNIDAAFDSAIQQSSEAESLNIAVEFWNENYRKAAASMKPILDNLLLEACGDPSTMSKVVKLDERRAEILAEITAKVTDIYDETVRNIRKEQAVITLFGNETLNSMPDEREVIRSSLDSAITDAALSLDISSQSVAELLALSDEDKTKVLAWNYALIYYAQAESDSLKLKAIYDGISDASPGESANEWCRNSWRSLQLVSDLSDYLGGMIAEVTETYKDYTVVFDLDRWNLLVRKIDADVAIYQSFMALASLTRGENPDVGETVLQLMCYNGISSAYGEVKEAILKQAGALITMQLLPEDGTTDAWKELIAQQYCGTLVSHDKLTAMSLVSKELFALSDAFTGLSTSSYATKKALRCAMYDALADAFTGVAERKLNSIADGISLGAIGYDEETLKNETYDVLYANLVPGKKIILGNLKNTGMPEPDGGVHTPVTKSQALELYVKYMSDVALDEIINAYPIGVTEYDGLADAEKVAIFDAISEKITRVLTCYTENAVGDDDARSRLVIYWEDGLFGGNMDSQIASVRLGNATKPLDGAFEIPNVNYIKRQIIIDNIDFYANLTDEDGNPVTLKNDSGDTVKFYNQYVIDPLNCHLDENRRTTADAYGRIGVNGATNTYLGTVVVEFEESTVEFSYDGRYSRVVNATVYSADLIGGQRLPITVTYLDRTPEGYYVSAPNYTEEAVNPDTQLYSLATTDEGSFFVRVNPTDKDIYNAATSSYKLPSSMAITFNEDYGTDTLARALADAGFITERLDISDIVWDLQGNVIGFAGVDYKTVALNSFLVNGSQFTADPRMEPTFWNLLLFVPNRHVSRVSSLIESSTGSARKELATVQNGSLVSVEKLDPYNYDVFFPTDVTLSFEEEMTGGVFGDRGTIDLFGIEWTFSETRGLNYLKDPAVITGSIGENGMYITANFTYLSETVWVTFPIKTRYIDISIEGTENVGLRDGGTIYLIKGVDVWEQLRKYDSLYYNFGENADEDWSRVPLEFIATDVSQISTENVGIYKNIRGRMGEINDPNVYFTVMVVDPKLYALNADEQGEIREKTYYDRLTVGVSSYGNRVEGKEAEEGFLAGYLSQLEETDEHGSVIANRKDFTITKTNWDIAGKRVVFTCEYEFMTEYNDYTYLCHHTYTAADGSLVKVNTLEFTFTLPLDVYVYSSIDNNLTLDVAPDVVALNWELGKSLKFSDLPKASMGAGAERISLMWDLSMVNVNRAGAYDLYGYYRDGASAATKFKHIVLNINQVDISSEITSMYIETAAESYTGLELAFVPVVPNVLRESGDVGSLEIGTQILVDYITAARYNSNDGSTKIYRSQPYSDAGSYYARVRIVDYNIKGEALFAFTILPVEIEADDISFTFGADSLMNQVEINGWPSSLEEKDRMYYDVYRTLVNKNANIAVKDGDRTIPSAIYAKSYAYTMLYERSKPAYAGEVSLGYTLLNTYFNMLWSYRYDDSVTEASDTADGRIRVREVQALVWDLISPTGMNTVDFGTLKFYHEMPEGETWAWTNTSDTKESLLSVARASLPEGTEENDVILEAYRLLESRATNGYDKVIRGLYLFYLNKIDAYNDAPPADKLYYENSCKLKVWNAVNPAGINALRYTDDYPMTEAEKTAYVTEARTQWDVMDTPSESELYAQAYLLLLDRVESAVAGLMESRYAELLSYTEYGNITTESRRREIETEVRAQTWQRLGFNCIYGSNDYSTADDLLLAKAWPTMGADDAVYFEKEEILDNGYKRIVEVEVQLDISEFERSVREAAYEYLRENVRTSAQEKLDLLLEGYKVDNYSDLDSKTQAEIEQINHEAKAGVWEELDVTDNFTVEQTYVYDGKTHLPSVSGMPKALIQNWPATVEAKNALLAEARSENTSFTDAQAKTKAYENLYLMVNSNAGALTRLDSSKEAVLRSNYSDYFLPGTSAEDKKRMEDAAKAIVWDTLPVGADAAVEEVMYSFVYRYTDMNGHVSETTSQPVNAGSYDIVIVLNEASTNYVIKTGDTIQASISITKSTISQNFVNEMVYTGNNILPIAPELFINTTPASSGEETDPNAALYDDVFETYVLPAGVTVNYTFYKNGKSLTSIRDVGEYYFSVVVNGGNNYPDWSIENQIFNITPRKLLIEVGNVSGNYLEELYPLNSSVTFKGKSDADNLSGFGETVCESVVTSRHIVGDYDINFVGFRYNGVVYYLTPAAGQKGVEEFNKQLFDNYDISIVNGTYTINKASADAITITTPEELQMQYNNLAEGSTAVWYLAGNNYGDLVINKNVNLTIIGCYNVNTIGASDALTDSFDRMKASAAAIDVVFSKIIVQKGSVSLDIVRFDRVVNDVSVLIGQDAGYVEIARSGFLPPAGSTDSGVLNAIAVNVLSGYSKRLTLNNTYIEGYTSGVYMNYLDVKSSGQENKLEVIDCRMSRNQNAIYALNGRMDINGCKIEYTTGVAVYLDMQSGFSVSGCEFIGNEVCIQSRTLYQEDLRTDNTFSDNVTEVTGI